MLDIQLRLSSGDTARILNAAIWNVSALAARSDYEFKFEGRTLGDARLEKYPRWCESVEGLVARCLALTNRDPSGTVPGEWTRLAIAIALRPAGRGRELLSTLDVWTDAKVLSVVCTEQSGTSRRMEGAMRAIYDDPWDIVDHALRLSTFGYDELPTAVELDVPVRSDEGLSFVCMRDIPEPARSAFERRMRGSGVPVIPGYPDAVYSWDWLNFLGAS